MAVQHTITEWAPAVAGGIWNSQEAQLCRENRWLKSGTPGRDGRKEDSSCEASFFHKARLRELHLPTSVVQTLRKVMLLGRQGRIKGHAFVSRKVPANSL